MALLLSANLLFNVLQSAENFGASFNGAYSVAFEVVQSDEASQVAFQVENELH